MPFLDATVILFKCNHSKKSFGARVEKNENNDWVRTWAFPVDDTVEKMKIMLNKKFLVASLVPQNILGVLIVKHIDFSNAVVVKLLA